MAGTGAREGAFSLWRQLLVSWRHWDFPTLLWLGSPIHKPLFLWLQLDSYTVCRPSGPTHQSVLYQVALQKSFKPRDRPTQIPVSAWPVTLCVALANMLVLLGFTFFICQVRSEHTKSLCARLETLKSLPPWVRISLGCLGGTELSGDSPVATLWKGQG